MKQLTNPLAIAAFTRAAVAAGRVPPVRRIKGDSRSADKFVIRGYVELFEEISGIGTHQGRSINSEVVAAILDSLDGQVRSLSEVRILKAHLGEEMAKNVLAVVPDFTLDTCKEERRFIVRFPPNVRDKIRKGVETISVGTLKAPSMNNWMLTALVAWVNVQRQHYALLSATIAIDQKLLEGR